MRPTDPPGDLVALHELCDALGVLRHYVDGLHRPVDPGPETLTRICAALGAPLASPADAPDALRAHRAAPAPPLPPVIVAWDGVLPPVSAPAWSGAPARITLETGGTLELHRRQGSLGLPEPLPPGYHVLEVESAAGPATAAVISAPMRAWRPEGSGPAWGVGTHLAALRGRRSRSLGDLRDLESVCRWVGARGGSLVTVLPLLPTFNSEPAEPSPYSPVSRLFWSELVLDLGEAHRATGPVSTLDVRRADAEVRAALAGAPEPPAGEADDELLGYTRFRGAQARLGRNWRDWPAAARDGRLDASTVDPAEERFHRVAQLRVRRQLGALRDRLGAMGVSVGLDLAVGVHPDGYDTWSRQSLFAAGMSVGAPPDGGFPGGQDWGFAPVLPAASRLEGHRYLAASIGHQASLAGVLRVDHIMAWSRLYWIPHGMGLHEGTYVRYPAEELFAVLTLESHRYRCEVVGENLGTVPTEIHEGLPRHGIRGMFLALFEADAPEPAPPGAADVALIGTHDTPTLAGWIEGRDIDERVASGLLDADAAPDERERRAESAQRLADTLDASLDDLPDLLEKLLVWLGASGTSLVVPWLEDLWLEPDQVNLPGTPSSERPNWQRPMRRLLDDVLGDPGVAARIALLQEARASSAPET